MKNIISVGIIDYDDSSRLNIFESINVGSPFNEKVKVLFANKTFSFQSISDEISPDILLIDIQDQSQQILEQIKLSFPYADIVVLTNLYDLEVVRQSFRAGAVGYILKQTCMPLLVSALNITQSGGSYISPLISRSLIEQSSTSRKIEQMLTVRELQIAKGILNGLSYKMIAQQYALSLDTVRVYIKRVYRKLNINSKGELMAQLSL